MQKTLVYIGNPHGLHVRPCTELVQLVRSFNSHITIEHDGKILELDSPLKLLAERIAQGDDVIIMTEGEDEEQAMDAVAELLRRTTDLRADENTL